MNSFSCFIALAHSSSSVLIESVENRFPCFVPDLREKHQSSTRERDVNWDFS